MTVETTPTKIVTEDEVCLAGEHRTNENCIRWASCSLVGVREENQDTCAVVQFNSPESEKVLVMAVADGMGGYKGGKWAAKRGVRALLGYLLGSILQADTKTLKRDIVEFLYKAFRWANARIVSKAALDPEMKDMGTTAVCAVVVNERLCVASVGDSRCYILRASEVLQLTRDDSVVQTLIDQGFLTQQEAEAHPRSNEITRCLGSLDGLDDLAVTECSLFPGDVVLICSDGYWKGGAGEIASLRARLVQEVHSDKDIQQFVTGLVKQAIARGSDDNVTVALLHVCEKSPVDCEGNGIQHPAKEEV